MNRETLAIAAHNINRAYCASMGDDSQPTWDDAPEWQKQSLLAGVDLHLINPDATPEQSHEEWLARKIAEGWVYGKKKDVAKKQHPCCRPYAELPPEQKAKDYLFRAVVHELKGLGGEDNTAEVARLKANIAALERQLAAALNTSVPMVKETPREFDKHVQYIGKRETFTDTIYGTKLDFARFQVRAVPLAIARKFLTHRDLFREFDPTLEPPETPVVIRPPEDTIAKLEEARIERETKQRKENEISDLIDQVNQMTKAAVAQFVAEKYQFQFKGTEKLAEMRSEAVRMIHQFGPV